MDPNTPRAEAERWLGISEKLLASRDLVGSRSFAIRAREADPTNPISEQILAVVDTLMAAEKRVINSGHHDWYSILQLSHLVRDPDLIASHYRRLVLLLNPEHNHLPYADFAIRVVFDAWSVLSDPTKKWMYDSELSIFLQRTSAPPDPEPVRVDSSSSATYQFFQQPPPPPQQAPAPPQQQQWIHHLHQHEQPQERQLFQQQHHLQPQPPPPPPQSQWLPQTQSQLQQLLPEQQRPSPSQWLPQPPQQQRIPQAPLPQRPPQWLPEQQRPPPQQQPPKEPQVPPQLQRQQPQQQKQPKKKTPPPPPAPAPAQTTPPHRPLQPPPQPPPQQPPQPPPQKPPQKRPPQPSPQPQQPQKENIVGSKEDGIGRASNVTNEKATDNGNKKNECDDSANVIDNDNNHDGGEHIERFWTACPYCYYLYEYSKTFLDYTLRCQNCRRAFQAVQIPNPPETGDESSFCSWGFFPIGFSMTSWKKSMPNANGFGSNWMPFSPMFACPMQDVKKEVWTIVDASDDDDDLDVSSDDSDSSGDWGSNRKKVKRANGRSKRGRPGRKSNAEREKMANQHSIDGENSQILRTDVVNNNKVVASGSLRKQTGKGVRGRKKLDLNVEFSNEVEDHAPVARDGNGEEVGFFEGLDEFLSTLPILHVVGDDKAKPS